PGYRQNQRVQDQGVISSAELRIPLWRHPQRWGVIQLAPFSDVDHPDRPTNKRSKTLVSVGVGLRWAVSRFFSAQFYWGQNLTDVVTSGNLQDRGVQFKIETRFP
ncbi:MAG: BamA/TamA family outer membrane protein, partial [Deltaproteobacteria bacterium]|nr:BamA/TamA family outer membrane protein [Deltaproteobacteria bacterium]